jgi:ribosomal protein S20
MKKFEQQLEKIFFENLQQLSKIKTNTKNFMESFEDELGDVVDSLAGQAKDGKNPQVTPQQAQKLKQQAQQKNMKSVQKVDDKTVAGAVAKALVNKL